MFNTGLLTRDRKNYVIAFFTMNKERYNYDCLLKKELSGYYKLSDGRSINIHSQDSDIDKKLEKLIYHNSPSEIVFDPNLDIIIEDHSKDHIVRSRSNRWGKMFNDKEQDKREKLEESLDVAKRRVKNNFTLVVPQYYRGSIQLLLPLSLNSDKIDACLLLLRDKKDNGNEVYFAKTMLTLEMAYNNARLINRPESSWLLPKNISSKGSYSLKEDNRNSDTLGFDIAKDIIIGEKFDIMHDYASHFFSNNEKKEKREEILRNSINVLKNDLKKGSVIPERNQRTEGYIFPIKLDSKQVFIAINYSKEEDANTIIYMYVL